jgi:hypothetical protein
MRSPSHAVSKRNKRVVRHVKSTLGTLRLPRSPDDDRRVLAVLTHLHSRWWVTLLDDRLAGVRGLDVGPDGCTTRLPYPPEGLGI